MRRRIRNGIAACLVAALWGCRAGNRVSISGVVRRPGAYAYRAGWSGADYLAAAGGYGAEADTAGVLLVRAEPDSSPGAGEPSRRTVQWPLTQAPAVRPGDRIFVPARAYAVRMDTVHQIENLVVHRGRWTYRVARGVLVPGWTERGVMAAVEIGDGEAFQDGRVLTQFHYLYFRMHPERYADLVRFLGPTVKDRDAREDADAVYRVLSEKGLYRSENGMMVPPKGYFFVQAGVWLAPKSAAYPGPGMRKRRFPDGREWTTFPDGRQRMEFPDGRVEADYPDSTHEVRYPDGRVTLRDAAGNLETRYPDGHREWKMASGGRSSAFPDGRQVYRFADGAVETVFPDGTEKTVFPDGTRKHRYPDGRVQVTSPNGQREMRYPSGWVSAVTPEGYRIETFPDGRQVTRTARGIRVVAFPDGRKVQYNPDGAKVMLFADGRRRTVLKNGTQVIREADGTRRMRFRNRTELEVFPDGRKVQKLPDGTRIEVFPDGRKVQHNPDGAVLSRLPNGTRVDVDAAGDRVEVFPDGRRRETFADPFRYRGALRTDLVHPDSVPAAVASGAEVVVSGTVVDSVQRLSLAVFRLPDGRVLASEAKIQDGRFEGRVRPGRAGYYRLQVEADVGGPDSWTVLDRMLKVGSPPALKRGTLESSAFPGARKGEARLVELVNSARKDAGLRPLRDREALHRVAAARLSDLLFFAYFSHRSPIGKTVVSEMRFQGVRFRVVGENLCQAASVEDVHAKLMLSAGHRENILNRVWTGMGVAVARKDGLVWAVEVFSAP